MKVLLVITLLLANGIAASAQLGGEAARRHTRGGATAQRHRKEYDYQAIFGTTPAMEEANAHTNDPAVEEEGPFEDTLSDAIISMSMIAAPPSQHAVDEIGADMTEESQTQADYDRQDYKDWSAAN